MNQFKKIMTAALITLGLAGITTLTLVDSASAVDVFQGCSGGNSSAVCNSKGDNAQTIIKNVINTILVVLGMIAVIMIVIGGIRYTTSNGDSGSVKSAKDTILYSVVGLVVAILSFAIVNFVVGRF